MGNHHIRTSHDLRWLLVAAVTVGAFVVALAVTLLRLEVEQDATPHIMVVTPTTYGPPPA